MEGHGGMVWKRCEERYRRNERTGRKGRDDMDGMEGTGMICKEWEDFLILKFSSRRMLVVTL